MINRLKEHLEEPEERPPESDYFIVSCRFEDFYVDRATAERILRRLNMPLPPRWVRFTDIYGASVSVRARLIDSVRECTETQRTAERQFQRARRLEEKADRRP